jgi:hypothetical protein
MDGFFDKERLQLFLLAAIGYLNWIHMATPFKKLVSLYVFRCIYYEFEPNSFQIFVCRSGSIKCGDTECCLRIINLSPAFHFESRILRALPVHSSQLAFFCKSALYCSSFRYRRRRYLADMLRASQHTSQNRSPHCDLGAWRESKQLPGDFGLHDGIDASRHGPTVFARSAWSFDLSGMSHGGDLSFDARKCNCEGAGACTCRKRLGP